MRCVTRAPNSWLQGQSRAAAGRHSRRVPAAAARAPAARGSAPRRTARRSPFAANAVRQGGGKLLSQGDGSAAAEAGERVKKRIAAAGRPPRRRARNGPTTRRWRSPSQRGPHVLGARRAQPRRPGLPRAGALTPLAAPRVEEVTGAPCVGGSVDSQATEAPSAQKLPGRGATQVKEAATRPPDPRRGGLPRPACCGCFYRAAPRAAPPPPS